MCGEHVTEHTADRPDEHWRSGDITYYLAGGGAAGGGPGGKGGSSQITTWVEAHYKSAAIGGQTVYLLLRPKC